MPKKVRGREKFQKFEKYLKWFSSLCVFFPLNIRMFLFEQCRMIKGTKGLAIRYILIKAIAVQCGDNVSIHPGVYILRPDNLSIGNNVSIHPMCYIDSTGGIEVGNDVSIAHGATILSTTHNYKNINLPIKDQGIEFIRTKVKDNVWIGAKVTILAGKEIESGSIIAANAVITRDVPKNVVIAGVPGKIIKKRAVSKSDG